MSGYGPCFSVPGYFFFLRLQLQLLLLEPDFLLAGAIKKKICSKNMCNYFLLKAFFFFLKMEVKVDEALQRKGGVTITKYDVVYEDGVETGSRVRMATQSLLGPRLKEDL